MPATWWVTVGTQQGVPDMQKAFAAIFGRVQPMVFGETTAKRLPHAPAMTPVFLHLGIVLMLGLYIPPYLTRWFHEAARMLG